MVTAARHVSAWVLFAAITVVARPALAEWEKVKPFVQDGVRIVREDQRSLVLGHGDVLIELVLTAGPAEEAHIFSTLEWRRGTNPYRVWIATERLWRGRELPRNQWGLFFRTPFLRILRVPRGSS